MSDADWKILVQRYSEGKPICNCGNAYYTPCGRGSVVENGVRVQREDLLVCAYGCSSNQLSARNDIARRVIADLPGAVG